MEPKSSIPVTLRNAEYSGLANPLYGGSIMVRQRYRVRWELGDWPESQSISLLYFTKAGKIRGPAPNA